MKKFIQMFMIMLLLFAGCNHKSGVQDLDPVSTENRPTEESVSEQIEILAEIDHGAIDNTRDAYMATAKASLDIAVNDKKNGEMIIGLSTNVICNSRGVRFGKHIYDSYEKSWDEIRMATDSGEEISEKCELPKDEHSDIWSVGALWESDGMLFFVNGKDRSVFLQTNKELQIEREIKADCLVNNEDKFEIANICKVDAKEHIHVMAKMAYYSDGEENRDDPMWRYLVLDQDGNELFEWHDDNLSAPGLHYDVAGNVILQTRTYHETGRIQPEDRHFLYEWDETAEKMVALDEFPMTDDNRYWYYNKVSPEAIMVVNPSGIFLTEDGIEKELYMWGSHGISLSNIEDAQMMPDGRIQVIYISNGKRRYIALKETGDKQDITEVELAVSAHMKQTYQSAANEFNKKFPAYHITVRDDYDEKQLITKLTAREGPVLIDSSILGFEQYKKLWMPLGNLFVQLGIEKELIPNAMKLGEIDGELYGVISNFWIETVITKSVNARHWDYDEFMKLVREKPIKAISNYQNGDKGMLLFTSLLNHGLEDNYFLDKELGGKSFASKEFYALLELAENYYGEGALGQQDAVLWPEGDTLCHLIDISKPEDLELYKAVYGEELYFAGYPSGQGQGHYLNAMEPLTIRNTAGTKEKAIALTFMKYLLSEEVQIEASRDHNFFLSVRRDVLGKQVQGVERGMEVTKYGYAPFKIMDDPDTETDEKMLFELIDSSSPRKYFPKELRDIIYGELNEYFEGMITKDALSDHLENRVSLYLNEEN